MLDTLMDALRAGYWGLGLNDVDGELWATNSYWAIALPDSTPIRNEFRDLLRLYNLPMKPMMCGVGDTIMLDDHREPPNIAKLVKPCDALLEPVRVGGESVIINTYPVLAYVFGPLKDGYLCLNKEYLDFLDSRLPTGGRWYHTGATMKPCMYMHDGKPRAMLMGIRNSLVAP